MVLLLVGLIAGQAGIGATAYFTDAEPNAGNTFEAWISSQWMQTTQADFNAGVLSNVDTSSSPGDVKLAVKSGWYNTFWSRRKPITINNAGSSLTDYQVKVNVTYDSDMKPNFDDIRFADADGSTLLSHWQESYTASTSAIFWVKVPSVPSGAKTIYMYYGNSSASSASNVSSTFSGGSFSDTFTDSSKIDTGASSNIAVSSGNVEIATYSSSTTLYSESDNRILIQLPNDNYGTQNFIALQVFGSTGRQRSLIKFNLASIPSNATINTATLKSKVYSYVVGSPGGRTVYAYRLTNSWTETGSTWNKRDGINNWGTAGGDYATSGGASSTVPSVGSWQQWNVVTIVQAWVNGTSNYGVLLKDNNEAFATNTAWTYYSREASDDPELYINYTVHYTTATLRSVLIPEDTNTRLAVGTQLSWNDSEPTNTDIKYQVEYKADGSWELVPDSVLSGNSAGFDASTVDISSVKTDYGQIRLKGSLSTTDVSTTPTVNDWTVTYYYRKYASPEPTTSVGSEEGMYVSTGTIASQVLDTGISGATWNALFWDETTPASTNITFEVRASNTSFLPDSGEPPSWVSVGGTSPVTSGLPSGQYMQWRATLTTSDTSNTPTLQEVTTDYY